jgi:anaerobic selenocysteine-containing dehydrogenase
MIDHPTRQDAPQNLLDRSGVSVHPRICPFCEQNCGVLIEVDHAARSILSVRGDPDDPFSKGYICPKAYAAKELHSDPDIVRTPLIKRNGQFEPASWEQALDYTAERLAAIKAEHGANALGLYFGNPVSHIPGPIFHLPALLGTLGTTQIYSATSVDHTPQLLTMLAMYGGYASFPVPDIDRTDYFVLVGTNPLASNGSLMTAPGVPRRLEELRRRGGKVIVIDPRRTETAKVADWYLPIRPEADAWLMLALVHVLFAEDLVDCGRLASRLKGLEELRAVVADHSPESVAAVCGIPADDIRTLARELAAARSACIYGRVGTTINTFGTLTNWLMQCLNILTGNLDEIGGMMFPYGVFGQILGAEKVDGDTVPYGRWHSRVSGAPEVAAQLPMAVFAEEIDTPGEGQIRALLTICGNPALSCQNDGGRLDRALASLEFMVSFDVYINETTRHADVILPSPDHMSHSDFPIYFVPFMVRNYIKWVPAIFEAEPGVWQDSEIYSGLNARLLGIPAEECDARALAILFEQLRAGGNPVLQNRTLADVEHLLEGQGQDRMFDLLVRSGPDGDHFGGRPGGLTLGKVQQHPHGLDLGPMEPGQMDRVIHHGDGLIDLFPPLITPDLERLFAYDFSSAGLKLIGRRQVRSSNSWMHNLNVLVKGPDRCTLMISPADAAERGIADGAQVAITSVSGEIVAKAQVTDEMRQGTVSLPHGWGHGQSGAVMEIASNRPGVNINAISDSTRIDRPSWNAAFNGLSVEIRPVAPGQRQAASVLSSLSY